MGGGDLSAAHVAESMKKLGNFIFRRLDSIGGADAEEDKVYLNSCFVDKGDLEVLANLDDARRILVGRTGSGKTALLKQLQEQQERVINLPPESLALAYISNSTILQFIMALGVNLDVFFRLLWRHVFAVELLKRLASTKTEIETGRGSIVDWLRSLFSEKKRLPVFEYLQQWGDTFWEDTDSRIKETTKKLKTELKATAARSDARVRHPPSRRLHAPQARPHRSSQQPRLAPAAPGNRARHLARTFCPRARPVCRGGCGQIGTRASAGRATRPMRSLARASATASRCAPSAWSSRPRWRAHSSAALSRS